MGRTPCCLKVGLNRGPWTPEEDLCLASYMEAHGEGGWRTLPKKAGLLRCGKSCRLRWMNYLRPDVKHGHILPEEEDLILRLHRLLGNRWSLIAGRMPGRTDNEVKNYWNTHLSKKLISQGIDPRTHKPLSESEDICSSPGNSELSHKSQKENNAEIPRNVADGAADFQDTVASKGAAIAEDQTSGKSPANQLLESSPSQPASVAVDFVSRPPSISSTPHSFQQSITSTCVPGGVSDSVDINHNKGCKQISFPPFASSTFFFRNIRPAHPASSSAHARHNKDCTPRQPSILQSGNYSSSTRILLYNNVSFQTKQQIMPAVRTLPPAAKPVKTERTHAENQERAYIAASRRSDRSLEARVESARRASEIHKKRTGRSLRVTEADVINEEMYEEEDDDLPAQIRRITAHLHTGNDPFNRRLQAYLANHIAMRSALGQVVADNWQQQQMQNNNLNQYLTPNLMQQQQTNQFAFQNPMLPPQSTAPHSPQSFRSSPYPVTAGTPNAQGQRTGVPHARSASIANTQSVHGQPTMLPSPSQSMSAHSSPVEMKPSDRRFSQPAVPRNARVSPSDQHSSTQSSPVLSRSGSSMGLATAHQTQQSQGNRPGPLNLSHPMFTSPFGNMGDMNFGPLVPTLPLESQQLLAGAPMAELNDPTMAAMMQTHLVPTPGGSFASAPGFYSYNPNGSKGKGRSPAMAAPPSTNMGLNATLAPSMLDVNAPPAFLGSGDAFITTPYTPTGFGYGFESSQPDLFSLDGHMSGQMTPGETDWNLWIESQALSEEAVAA